MKTKLHTLKNVISFIFRHVPISASLSMLYYLADAFYPAITAVIVIKIFNGAVALLDGRSATDLILSMTGYLMCFLVLNGLLIISSVAINAGVYEKINHYYRIELGGKAASLPLISLEKPDVLNCYQRANSCIDHEFQSSLFMTSITTLCSIVGIVSLVAVLATYSPFFVLISMFSVFPYFVIKIIRGREFYRMRRFQAKADRSATYFWKKFFDLKSIQEMRALNYDAFVKSKWKQLKSEVNEEEYQFKHREVKSLLWCDCLRVAGYLISILLTLYLAYRGIIEVAVVAACVTAFQSVQTKTMDFFNNSGSLGMQLEFSSDYEAFMDLENQSDGIEKIPQVDEITMEHVSFSYPGREFPAVKDLSFRIKRGQKVVIVGENGCGKTTMLKLLMGLYRPEQGNIYYNHKDVRVLDKKALYEMLAVVPQGFTQFKLSARDNVLLGNDNIPDRRLNETLEWLHVPEKIQKNTNLLLGKDFGGVELSGGQWQRLALARGLVRNSEVLVLDEPTAALDPVAEYNILKEVFENIHNQTLIVITHRVGLCKLADQVIMLDAGQVIGAGTHSELVHTNEKYQKLYSAQSKWYE